MTSPTNFWQMGKKFCFYVAADGFKAMTLWCQNLKFFDTGIFCCLFCIVPLKGGLTDVCHDVVYPVSYSHQ